MWNKPLGCMKNANIIYSPRYQKVVTLLKQQLDGPGSRHSPRNV